jgi:signal transduction histidine kinase
MENLLLQRQTEERYAADVILIEKKVAEKLSDLVGSLQALARDPRVVRLDISKMTPLLLGASRLDEIPVENIFAFDDQNQLLVPPPRTAASAPGNSLPVDLEWGSFREEIDRLEHLEFVEKDLEHALQGYQALYSQMSKTPLRAALLKNIAVVYRKLHQDSLAEREYLKLIHEYDQLADPSGYPMGILARKLLIQLYDRKGSWERAQELRQDLYEGLVLGRWKIPLSQQETLLQEVRQGTGHRGPWDRILALERRLEKLQPIGQAFAKQDWPGLSERLRKRGWSEQGGVLQLSGSREHLAVVAPILSPESHRRQGWLVALVPGRSVWPMVEHSMTELAGPLGLKAEIDEGGGPAKPGFQHPVNPVDPPLYFRLLDSNSSERDQLARRRRWIFGGMVGFSFVVIVTGIIVIGRAARRETEAANLKADFVANVSHELRTPLTAISHIGERLSLGRYRSEEERNEFYGLLGKETSRLRLLIEDVLDFSKMLAGKKIYRLERLDLGALVQEASDHFEAKAEAHGFAVRLDLAPETISIRGDRRSLLQALLNLMDNAMKYSGESRQIDVRVTRTQDRGRVAVQDYGIGIPEKEKPKIFEKFYRGEQAAGDTSIGGVGLGLAMVKHIVEGHQGNIWVESAPGQGSVFCLEFPLVQGGEDDSHSRD